MKRTLVMLMAFVMLLALAACELDAPTTASTKREETKASASVAEPTTAPTGPTQEATEPTNTPTEPIAQPTEPATVPPSIYTEPTTMPTEPTIPATEATNPSAEPAKNTKALLDELEDAIDADVEDTIGALYTEWESLKAEVTTYEQYIAKLEQIEDLYERIYNVTEQLCIRMYDYALLYAEIVLAADETFDDKYEFLDDIYDNVYEGIGDEIYDEIYDGILSEMYDTFYDGVLDDAYDYIPYSEWSKLHSDEYGMWSDTHSDVYGANSDARSDVYGFASDIRSELFDHDNEGATKELQKFRDKVARIKGNTEWVYQSNPELATVKTLEELEDLIDKDVSDTISSLDSEWAALKVEIDTYEKYVANVDKVEAFYEKVYDTTHELLLRQYEYTLVYTKMIMASDLSVSDKYDAMSDLYDCIYETACDNAKDKIYDDLLKDMLDTFYEGIIEDAKDDVPYSDWADIRSDEYGMWVDTRSDIYGDWVDTRSDIYGFYIDIRGELWGKDVESANEELLDFEEKFMKITKQYVEE